LALGWVKWERMPVTCRNPALLHVVVPAGNALRIGAVDDDAEVAGFKRRKRR
jgi:hypothetical protein